MQKEPNRCRRRFVVAIAALVGVLLVYRAVMVAVRAHVSGRIASVHGAVLDFEATDRAGRVHRADALRGKTVVLNFFRSGCVGCIAEKGAIQELVRRVDPDKVVVLGVMLDAVEGFDAEETERTLARLGYAHPVLMVDAEFVDAFHGAGWARVTPVTYVAGPDGRIVRSFRGHQRLETLLEALPVGSLRDG